MKAHVCNAVLPCIKCGASGCPECLLLLVGGSQCLRCCPVWTWSADHVVAHFEQLGQGEGGTRLHEERIDGSALLLLKEEDLRSLGIGVVAVRKHLALMSSGGGGGDPPVPPAPAPQAPTAMVYAPAPGCTECGGKGGHVPTCSKGGCTECGGRNGHTPNCSHFRQRVQQPQGGGGGGGGGSFCGCHKYSLATFGSIALGEKETLLQVLIVVARRLAFRIMTWGWVAVFCVSSAAQYFMPQQLVGVGAAPVSVVACDLNNDGWPDLVASNFFGNSLTVSLNDRTEGKASFSQQTLPTGSGPYGIVCLDLNNDARMDLMWSNDGTNVDVGDTVSWAMNLGVSGNAVNLGTPVTMVVGQNPSDLAVGDLNRDGYADVAIAITDQGQVCILFNIFPQNRTVGFQQEILSVGTAPYAVSMADFNRDGWLDIAVTNSGSTTFSVLQNAAQTGVFVAQFLNEMTVQAGQNPMGMHAADFNGDGAPDIAVTSSNMICIVLNTGLPNGPITFSTQQSFFSVGNGPAELFGGDLTNDSLVDLVTPNYFDNSISVLLNAGGRGVLSFAESTAYAAGHGPWGVAGADFNQDGLTDVVCVNEYDNTLSIFLNTKVPPATTAAPSGIGLETTPGTAPPVGAIVGGVLGGIAFVVVAISLLLLWRNKQRKAAMAMAEPQPSAVDLHERY